jgi:hypothetical protein
MIWFGQLVWAIGFASLFLVLLLFPDGKVPSPGWRINFYRAKFDAAQTLEGFGARFRDEIDRDALIGELLQVVDATMQPAHASVWLNSSSAGRTVTMSGRANSTGDAGDD